mmetsp:Transcript_901/g.2870  ORF Transcript_901/g.2870 Transcript_901/m.2870 type:complete len:257 (-) Transcript_901:88-858(-)|eukprot:CAMPEP_0198726462 /NCGR_PEP_ID=MMETSP1475-20131203/3500_1 /TAXON_ID= ORGANISM="Unidentified sp., Strain CCMP1999" /NCGR_SAMPLE_ID=MMETSP1475 /ASSEMBLY_ACC=CAM_ASM_001111 /LENGTH=256 /DNA_ID=CAMNT_0044488385 /DNA_START=101 /DNA_END=871 /DNA_ORIENTATION=+
MAFVSGGLVAGGRGRSQRVCCRRTGRNVGVSMTLQENQSAEKLADFTQLDLSDAGNEFKGMVFKADPTEFPATRCNVDYEENCEAAINNQINVEYTASYAYHAMYAYFKRDTVGLPGFAKYFKDMSDEEREHAEKLMEYQNARGGRVVLKPVAVPEMQFNYVDGTSDALYAMDLHLQLEKFVYEKIRGVHRAAEVAHDPQLADYMETFLTDQVKAIKMAADYVAQIRRVGTGHGVYNIDLQLLEGNLIPQANFELQ